ncbi:hypothetical protein EVAR_68954_1 [Eumeta japonica]|uniref:Uncharacterized protein n=1 Tax=Eumeta variegata TaxID=151549 RepID=A0A4C2A572_EUMVA|nr:hypothetical protein EVAR_68954_1 [Eumeta japonica]
MARERERPRGGAARSSARPPPPAPRRRCGVMAAAVRPVTRQKCYNNDPRIVFAAPFRILGLVPGEYVDQLRVFPDRRARAAPRRRRGRRNANYDLAHLVRPACQLRPLRRLIKSFSEIRQTNFGYLSRAGDPRRYVTAAGPAGGTHARRYDDTISRDETPLSTIVRLRGLAVRGNIFRNPYSLKDPIKQPFSPRKYGSEIYTGDPGTERAGLCYDELTLFQGGLQILTLRKYALRMNNERRAPAVIGRPELLMSPMRWALIKNSFPKICGWNLA